MLHGRDTHLLARATTLNCRGLPDGLPHGLRATLGAIHLAPPRHLIPPMPAVVGLLHHKRLGHTRMSQPAISHSTLSTPHSSLCCLPLSTPRNQAQTCPRQCLRGQTHLLQTPHVDFFNFFCLAAPPVSTTQSVVLQSFLDRAHCYTDTPHTTCPLHSSKGHLLLHSKHAPAPAASVLLDNPHTRHFTVQD